MYAVSDVESPVEAELRRAVRSFRRASAAHERARRALREAIAEASSSGKGPAEITRLIDHEYDVAHVSRIIHGKA